MLDRIRGKRTYLLAASALLAILVRYADGQVGVGGAVTEALVALGLVTARAGATNDARGPVGR